MVTRQSTFDESTRFVEVETLIDLPSWARLEQLAGFLYQKMKPYEDTRPDVERGLRYALDPERPGDGFAILAVKAGRLAGAVVFVTTQMQGYIPENILLFICVDPNLRGQGLGRRLILRGLARCQGQIKLHVEPDNPAKRLYERLGFVHKYDELRHAGVSGK
jgi:ribosomal-protein-alanine N-acetyltransferase